MHTTPSDGGETDRQMVLIHVDNTLLAMRTSSRLSRRKGGYDDDAESSEYAAAQGLLDLQRRLFAGAVPVPGPTSSSSPVSRSSRSSPLPASSSAFTAGASIDGRPPVTGGLLSPSPMHAASSAAHYEVSEVAILSAFANVCRSPSTSAVVTGVALTALVDMLDLPCGFISTYGVHTAIEAASETRADVHDNGSHEVLLSRIFSVYVAALNHPAAAMAEGDVHVRAIGRMMVLATLPEASQLLKRTVEKSMRSIVMTLFRRLLYLPSDPLERDAVVGASTLVLQFISRLISGEVASFDSDGHEVAASTVAGGDGFGSAGASSGDERESATERSIALVQLEGLALAQDCLLLLRRSLDTPPCAPLLDTVQNRLCRSLLIAGLGTSRSIVLSQVLRTVHLVMQSASEHLIPQIYNFIRVLHLNPLEALTNELSDAVAGSPVGSNSPVGKVSPSSPSSAASGTAFTRLSRTQLVRKQERRDILLDSLAEFCSDPRFGSFCFLHYDLSWRYSSLLPQLCQVLVNNAYPAGRDDDGGDGRLGGNGVHSGNGGGRSSGRRDGVLRLSRARRGVGGASGGGGGHSSGNGGRGGGSGGGGSRFSAGALLQHTQRTALDAATNMISGIALRAIEAGSQTHSSSTEAAAAPNGHGGASPSTVTALQQLTRQAMKEKETLNEFAALFEDSPMKKGIPYLLEHAVQVPRGTEAAASVEFRTQLVLAQPAGGREVGEALYRLSIVLNKRVLGDYIGEQGRDKAATATTNTTADTAASNSPAGDGSPVAPFFSVKFFAEQLVGFIHQFEFHQKPLLTAIREMVYLLCLPGESQKIDRVMETFAKHWYEQNLTRLPGGEVEKDENINPFHSESGAFVLSFAIIMLNTDQHSGKVAHQMKKEDFIKMNRGIDDGKDVPAEYLARVYDDVRQHEVVMADMMDRGFGNDTTWRLEMRPCISFLQIALGGDSSNNGVAAAAAAAAAAADAATPPAQLRGQAGAVEALASMSAHDTAAVPALDRSAVLRTFDPFLFQALWKRSLLVFDGMLESAVDEVTLAAVAQGRSLAEAVAEVQRRMPVELSVLQSSLRGVSMLARAAHAFGLPAVADQCLLGLLQHVMMDLSGAEEEVRMLYRSVPRMLCLAEVFALMVDIHSSLKDSWRPLARLLLDLQLMGLLVNYADKAAVASRRGSPPSGGAKSEGKAADGAGGDCYAVLLEDPGICAGVFAPLTAATTASQKSTGEKGWFSSFFGGNDTPQISEAELNELMAAQLRLRSCIPDMMQMLAMLQAVAADPHHGSRCVTSLCAACSITAPAPPQHQQQQLPPSAVAAGGAAHGQPVPSLEKSQADRVTEATAYAASYELSFICAVVGAASTPAVLQPAHLAPLTSRISRLLTEIGVYLGDARAGENVRRYWVSLGHRVVGAALQLMAARWGGQEEGAVALEQLWTCWMHAPAAVFTAIVAPHVASFLFQAVVVEGSRTTAAVEGSAQEAEERREGSAELSSRRLSESSARLCSSGSEVLVLLAPFATHAAATTDTAVQRQISTVLLHVVQRGLYSVVEDTESVVSLCLSFSVWARDVSDSNSARGGRGEAAGSSSSSGGSGLPSGASVAEVLSLCGRNVLIRHANPSDAAGAWYAQWLFVLRSLGALALCSPEARDGSEALLCLQRALLDSEAKDLPASAVVAVYKDILIPLTERLCVPRAKVQAGLRWSSTAARGTTDAADAGHSEAANTARRGMVSGLFTALLAPTVAGGEEAGAVAAAASATAAAGVSASSGTARRPAPPSLVSTEVKCRLLSLVPKALLRYTAALTSQQEALLLLWRQVLGTLYAVYSAYPGGGAAGHGGDGGAAAQDEAMLVQEAVEETVKNMVYVMAATWKDPAAPAMLQAHTAAFWVAIARLVEPFPFSAPLIEFMVNEKLVQTALAEQPAAASAIV